MYEDYKLFSFQGPDTEDHKPGYGDSQNLITGDFRGGWLFYSTMHSVMESIKATSPDGGTKSRRSPEYTCKFSIF